MKENKGSKKDLNVIDEESFETENKIKIRQYNLEEMTKINESGQLSENSSNQKSLYNTLTKNTVNKSLKNENIKDNVQDLLRVTGFDKQSG